MRNLATAAFFMSFLIPSTACCADLTELWSSLDGPQRAYVDLVAGDLAREAGRGGALADLSAADQDRFREAALDALGYRRNGAAASRREI